MYKNLLGDKKIIIAAIDTKDRLFIKTSISQDFDNLTLIPDINLLYEILDRNEHNLAICVHQQDSFNIIKILKDIKSKDININFLILGRPGTIEEATEAMKLGARDFIPYPWDKDIILTSVKNILINSKKETLISANYRNSDDKKTKVDKQHEIITVSPVMQQLLKKAKSVAKSKASVLIQGESGTGKELLARYIHRESDRASGPFVAVNCAALPETLLESELFGHEKGAFSGAISRRLGKFELANHGTILLDEITEMQLCLQAKLLRVLQESEIDRLGGQSPIPIDVRVIATTNRDIKQVVSEGKFREDLYFRLNVIPLKIPPLRARPEDIEALAKHFCKYFCKQYSRDLDFASGVIETLKSWPWPGNVRELRNVIERGVLLAQGSHITLKDLTDDEQGMISMGGQVISDQIMTLEEMEKFMIKKALGQTNGNRTHAAKLLGISVRTLRNKLAEFRRQGIVL